MCVSSGWSGCDVCVTWLAVVVMCLILFTGEDKESYQEGECCMDSSIVTNMSVSVYSRGQSCGDQTTTRRGH